LRSDRFFPSVAERDRHIARLIRGSGLGALEAAGLNVQDVYDGQRVKRTLISRPASSHLVYEVLLDRGLRESIAVILGSTAGSGFAMHPHLPLLLHLDGEKRGSRMTAEDLQLILEKCAAGD
jgi:hypothetical protein